MVGVSGFEPEAVHALLEADAPTRSPLRGNRSGMATKRPRVRIKKQESTKDSCFWSECRDSNPRPLGPEPSAIPNLDKLERTKCFDLAPKAGVFTTLLYQMTKRKAREIC